MYKTFFSTIENVQYSSHKPALNYISARFGPLATLAGYLGKGFLKQFQTDFHEQAIDKQKACGCRGGDIEASNNNINEALW